MQDRLIGDRHPGPRGHVFAGVQVAAEAGAAAACHVEPDPMTFAKEVARGIAADPLAVDLPDLEKFLVVLTPPVAGSDDSLRQEAGTAAGMHVRDSDDEV